MTVQSRQNACTSTCCGKLFPTYGIEEDEMYVYVEITELLMIARVKPRIIVDSTGSGDKNLTLPMRKSLFAHVPPFIIFQNKNTANLPPEITKHLLWWHTKKCSPRIIASMVQKSGFKITTNSTTNWCGTWCSKLAYSRLKRTKNFSKINQFPNNSQLGNKILLWKNFRRMKKKHGWKNFEFMPLSFVLPEERSVLRKYMQKNCGIWIVKPPASSAGCGIKIVSRLCEIPDHHPLVVQRYISKPRLIDGVKFDMRLYVLLTSIDPLRIYVYNNGLVRLATVKYVNHVSTLSDRFMHLTNTSVNKFNPNFKTNDSPTKCKGNMWSLNCLWKYLSSSEDVDTLKIWAKIKDIAIKTVISAEPSLAEAWKKASMSTYNFYQLFGFDVLLDREYRPWLLEVNNFPSMDPDTPLCKIVKDQLAEDYLNLVGFHIPNVLTDKELKMLRMMYKQNAFCFNGQLYSCGLSYEDRKKQFMFSKMTAREDYLKPILKFLTPSDVRVLIRHEDEVAQTGRFEKIFPTSNTYQYFKFFDEIRYYNLLLDAWEHEYANDRVEGIERLRKLCKKKRHLFPASNKYLSPSLTVFNKLVLKFNPWHEYDTHSHNLYWFFQLLDYIGRCLLVVQTTICTVLL
ncbi:tubulin monoglutamylase TTLL4 [Calliopsis andreniformis]|uniref:tubulin monoglutamylase TTLL4 n=1 Tax=Calliopsis andreniformis TaxID=337506 RepID=UPI003FCEC2A0